MYCISKIDSEDYAPQILDWCLQQQNDTLPFPEYMSSQNEVNWKMRTTLVLWLVQVAQEFQLEQSTLFLSLNLLDRVGCYVQIRTHEYQLVGLVCLWIASKMEQNHGTVPSLKRLGHICCHTYSTQQFKAMETLILKTLKFKLNHSSPLTFVDLILERDGNDIGELGICLSQYFIEVSAIHKRFIGLQPDTLARAAIALAKLMLYNRASNEEPQVLTVMHQLMSCLHSVPSTLIKKYSTIQFQYCSKFVQEYTQPTLRYGMLTPPKDSYWGRAETWASSFRECAQWSF